MTNNTSKPKFCFVAYSRASLRPDERRVLEIADAAARSHAARAGHQVRKANILSRRKSKPPAWLRVRDDKPREDPVVELRLTSYSRQNVPCLNGLPLDAFVSLPVNFSPNERSLLHEYLTSTPHIRYPFAGSPTFSAVEHVTFIGIITNRVFSSWVALHMQHLKLSRCGVDPERDLAALLYRKQAYKLMGDQLTASEKDPLSEALLYGLIVAGVIENHVGRPQEAEKHLDAGITLWEAWRKKGTRKPITNELGVIICGAYVFRGVKHFFKRHATLRAIGLQMMQRLGIIQQWNRRLRQDIADGSRPQDIGIDHGLQRPDAEYISSRRHFTAKGSIVRGHLELMLQDTSVRGTRTCLAALFAINTTLWACQFADLEASDYMRDLLQHLVSNEPCARVNGPPKLPSRYALDAIALCGLRAQQRCSVGEMRFDPWDVASFVELMMLAGQSSRRKLTAAMTSWLLVDVGQPERLVLWTCQDVGSLTQEVEVAWARKHAESMRATADRARNMHEENVSNSM